MWTLNKATTYFAICCKIREMYILYIYIYNISIYDITISSAKQMIN